jgi:hypothetical protein
MPAASNRVHDKIERPSPRGKAARLSPELDEVLRMLKALENQPDSGREDHDKSR